MVWAVVIALALLFIFICLWRFRIIVRIEFRTGSVSLWFGIRLAGFIPAGTLGIELTAGNPNRLDLSYGAFRLLIRFPLNIVTFREYSRKKGKQIRRLVSPVLHGDIVRRSVQVKSILFLVRDLYVPLDILCKWGGLERILDSILGLFGCRFSIRLSRQEDVILKIRADLVMNLLRLSKIKLRNLRKKVRSWNSTPLKTSCSRP